MKLREMKRRVVASLGSDPWRMYGSGFLDIELVEEMMLRKEVDEITSFYGPAIVGMIRNER